MHPSKNPHITHKTRQACATHKTHATFTPIAFTRPGNYHFTIRELPAKDANWSSDLQVCPVLVTVIRCENNRLHATLSYPDGLPVFSNKYLPTCTLQCTPATGQTIYLPR